MPGDGVEERPLLNLERRDAEIEMGGESLPLRHFSSVAWRREQYTAVNHEAYHLYTQLTQAFSDLSYAGIPLLPLMQRHLTETFVTALEQVVGLRAFLNAVQPTTIMAANEYTAVITQLAIHRAQSHTRMKSFATPLRFTPYRRVGESMARNAIYLLRIRRLRAQKPPIPLPSPDHPRLLFHPYYPNHLPSFLPLIKKLQADGRFDIWVAGADTNTLRQGDVDPTPVAALRVPYVPFETAVSWPRLLHSMTRGIRFAERLGRELRIESRWRELPLDKTMRHLAQIALVDLIETRLPKILLFLDMAAALYQTIQPNLVIVTDETLPILGRVALRAAQQQHIPTLTLQHGLLLDDPMYFGPAVADCFAVWAAFSRDFLVANGCPPQKLALVGSSRFSPLDASLTPLDLPALLNLPVQTRVVLFTSQPGGRDVSPQANLATFVALATAVSQLPHCHLLVKPHPAQTNAELDAWRQACPDAPVTFRRDLPLHSAMLGAAVNATVFSTTGLEALWLDCPLLTINLTDRPDLIPYAASGAAVAAYSAEEVLPALQQALDPADQQDRAPARRRFVERYLGAQDGRALDRLVALIAEMVS